MRIYEQNPSAKPALCPKMLLEGTSHAARPLSSCRGCPHMSYMSCNAPHETSYENTVKSAKNILQWL
ncbi:MAG: hypothetical protein FWC76_00575 [Defluviitaleaceae bacterium]|nr:hypothetical protein [Defluviitaleaceae bacterium]